jgi:glucose-6-phosphate 1-epimerase
MLAGMMTPTPTADTLHSTFGIAGLLAFDEPRPGMPRARITTPACTAELYLQGAHLTQWQPAGSTPVLYLSPTSVFAPGKAIRGGIPVIFPWFGARTPEITGTVSATAGKSPSHGFARTQSWQLEFAALLGDDLRLVLTLGPTEVSRSYGFDHFRIVCELTLGNQLTVRLTVVNEGTAPLVFEEALHAYYAVSDAAAVSITGLEDTVYLDKTDSFKRSQQGSAPITFTRETDRPYLNTGGPVALHDHGGAELAARTILISKQGSETTVVWNPWAELSATLPDLGPEAYMHFCCIEAANAAEDRITLAPGEAHALQMVVKALKSEE